jgi:hypothetical protein
VQTFLLPLPLHVQWVVDPQLAFDPLATVVVLVV